ncbi:sugar transferase [Mycobacterium sp. NPDC050551]|uniref:sugar transferase n=1 Tax=Mycobacterium sp. NPDC050551 TaxID=3155407 RepID=UPI00342B4B41
MTSETILARRTAPPAMPVAADIAPPSAVLPLNNTRPVPAAPELGQRQRYLLRISDVLALTASAALGGTALNLISPVRAGDLGVRDIIVTVLAMVVALHLHGLYRRPASRLRPSGWWRPTVIARCLPTAALLALGADALLFHGGRMTLTSAVAMTLPAVALVPSARGLVVRMFDTPTVTRIVVVGTGPISDRLTARLSRCADTLVVGHVDDNPAPGSSVLGGLADLPDVCAEHRADRVIVAFPNATDQHTLDALRLLLGQVPVSVIPRFFELHNWRSEVEELHGLALMHVPAASLGVSARTLKRAMDITLASCALAVVAPLWLVIAVAIRLDSPGPVFFRQERIGRAGKPFQIFKFRTMTDGAAAQLDTVAQHNKVDGPLFKAENDPRVTRVGGLLRRTSLDELPQFLNVVLGDMSLVGPRPLPTDMADGLDGAALTRLDVCPGITGLWQVCGRSDLNYADLQHLDSVYVRSWSLLWDLRIMLQTPRVVFERKGAY